MVQQLVLHFKVTYHCVIQIILDNGFRVLYLPQTITNTELDHA